MKIKSSGKDNLIMIDITTIIATLVLMVMMKHYHFILGILSLLFVLAVGVLGLIFYFNFYLGRVPFKSSLNLFRSYWIIRRDLYDSTVFSIRKYKKKDGTDDSKAILPDFKFRFVDANEIQLLITNKPQWQAKLENLNFSSSLVGWVVMNSYLDSSQNWMIYNLEDENAKQRHFTSYQDFSDWFAQYKLDKYCYVLDDATVRPLSSLYVFGVTGSGKSFLTEMLIEEFMLQDIDNITIVDPKNSDLAVLANHFKWNCGVTGDDALSIMRQAKTELEKRQQDLYDLMVDNDVISKTYADFGLKPQIVIIDEVAALIATMPKKQAVELQQIVSQIVLKGRQLGVYVMLLQQKYLSTDMPTAIKENCSVILMGSNGAMTEQTTFNQRLNPREMPIGSGHVKTKTDVEPRFFYAPFCDYNILDCQVAGSEG